MKLEATISKSKPFIFYCRTLANFVMFRLVDYAAVHSTSGMADFYIEYQKLIDGRQVEFPIFYYSDFSHFSL